MGLFGNLKKKLGKNKKQAAQAVDKVADVAEKKAPGQAAKIEQGAEKVKDVIEKMD